METPENNEVTSTEYRPTRRRRKKSIVWEHFTIESVGGGCRRACCKQCKQSFAYSTGSKVAGTSHLKRHIAKGTCPLRNQETNQLTPYSADPITGPVKRRYRASSSSISVQFDQDRCRQDIAKMIIMHDYPLHMVEHPGFNAFVRNLQPQFSTVSFSTVQGDCIATYLSEKHGVMKYLDRIPGKISLSVDLWSSSQSLGYVFLTAHFIDADWELQERLLNVVSEPYPESDDAFVRAISACLSDWNLENKIFSITLNRPSSDDVDLGNLRTQLFEKNPNGQILIGNCLIRALTAMAADVIHYGRETIERVRDVMKHAKFSEEKFLELKRHLQVPSSRDISLDNPNQWNTTYQMLLAASELQEVFSCFDTTDTDQDQKNSMTADDWEIVKIVCNFLKILFDAAIVFVYSSSSRKPTPNLFYHEVWKVQTEIARAIGSDDSAVADLSKTISEKFEMYWNDCSIMLAIAVAMDPRFKMKLVQFSFSKIYGEESETKVGIIGDRIHELFLEYASLPIPFTPADAGDGVTENARTEGSPPPGSSLLSSNGLLDFDIYIMETSGHHMKSELDQYLDEALSPRLPDFNVLDWWRLNKLKYPTLSRMARDVLSITVSGVSPESAFDVAGNVMDDYRSSLRAETVEALMCAKDWLQHGPLPEKPGPRVALKEEAR